MKPSCPNYSPDGLLVTRFGVTSARERALLFYGVCIWVRLLLCGAVFHYRAVAAPIVGAMSAIAVCKLAADLRMAGPQWWSKRFQLVMALLLLLCVFFRGGTTVFLPLLLLGSLVGGIVQSLVHPFC